MRKFSKVRYFKTSEVAGEAGNRTAAPSLAAQEGAQTLSS